MAAETAALLDAVVKATESCPAADEVHRPASELALALSRLQRPLAELKAALATLALPATAAAAPSAPSGERLTLLSRNAEEGIGSPPGALGGAGAGDGTGGADGSAGAGGESEGAGFDESQAARIVRHGQALLAAMPSWHTQLASLAPLSGPNRALLRPVTHHPADPLCRSSPSP